MLIRGSRSKDEDESKKISRQEDEQHPGVPHDDHRTRAKGADGGAFQPNVVAKQVLLFYCFTVPGLNPPNCAAQSERITDESSRQGGHWAPRLDAQWWKEPVKGPPGPIGVG